MLDFFIKGYFSQFIGLQSQFFPEGLFMASEETISSQLLNMTSPQAKALKTYMSKKQLPLPDGSRTSFWTANQELRERGFSLSSRQEVILELIKAHLQRFGDDFIQGRMDVRDRWGEISRTYFISSREEVLAQLFSLEIIDKDFFNPSPHRTENENDQIDSFLKRRARYILGNYYNQTDLPYFAYTEYKTGKRDKELFEAIINPQNKFNLFWD